MANSFYGAMEQDLAIQSGTISEFAETKAASNPSVAQFHSFPANLWWYEKANTVETSLANEAIWVTKRVYFGNLILFGSSGIDDSLDRDMAYYLFDLVTQKFIGYQPDVGQYVTIFPMEPVDEMFTQLDGGMTGFTSYWSILIKFGKDGGQ